MRTLAISMLAAASLAGASATPAAAAQRFVCPNGGCEYPTIQAAVDAADPGDTIRLRDGTYYEQVTVPAGKDELIFRGAQAGVPGDGTGDRGPESVLAGGVGTARRVLSSRVTVDGLTVYGSNVGVWSDTRTSGLQVVNSRFSADGNSVIPDSDGASPTTIRHNAFLDVDYNHGLQRGWAIVTGASKGHLLVADNRLAGAGNLFREFGARGTDVVVARNHVESAGAYLADLES